MSAYCCMAEGKSPYMRAWTAPRLNAGPVCDAQRRSGSICGLWRYISAGPLTFILCFFWLYADDDDDYYYYYAGDYSGHGPQTERM